MAYLVKFFLFLLVMAILNVIKEGVAFAKELINPRGEYKLPWKRTLLLFISISYIVTIIFLGL